MQMTVLFLVGCVMLVGASDVDVCVLRYDFGNCKTYTRWFFNTWTGKCQEFTYGGYGGNGNNFESKDKCERECPRCDLPAETGQCRASYVRYYYDKAGYCKKFTYGGCPVNSNIFMNMDDCIKTCKEK